MTRAVEPEPNAVPGAPRTGSRADLEAAVTGRELCTVFQPIVLLEDASVVGFEALTRWPQLGNPDPLAVFAHAAATDRLTLLNHRCMSSAVTTAQTEGLRPGALLLVNSEPASGYFDMTRDPVLERGRRRFRLVVEFTERQLLQHPRRLLQAVAALRADGIGVAIDDVGAHPDSLALLDVVMPDVIKLDLPVVQSWRGARDIRTVAAVLAHHERTGALILAEGIETDAHLEWARAIGATLGQGFAFGHPGPLDDHPAAAALAPVAPSQVPWSITGSPFDLVAHRTATRPAVKSTLLAFSRHIEALARQSGDAPIVLTAVQDVAHFTDITRARYAEIADVSPFVAVFGQGLPADLGHGVRGVALDPADPLCREWTVVTLGPHFAAAVLGREIIDADSDRSGERQFEMAITYHRPLVTQVARNLLHRIP